MSDWKDDFTEHAKPTRANAAHMAERVEMDDQRLKLIVSEFQTEIAARPDLEFLPLGQIVHTGVDKAPHRNPQQCGFFVAS